MRRHLAPFLAVVTAAGLGGCASFATPTEPPPFALDAPSEPPPQPPQEEDDGYLDITDFLDSKTGFLPVVYPITEPAVGYGGGAALAFFHTRPRVLQTEDGPRIVPPDMTIVGGLATANGSWAGYAGHLHTWDEGRVRYSVFAGNGSLNLDWFGQDDAFDGTAFSYNLQLWSVVQKLTMKIGESDFFWGVQQRYLATHSEFDEAPGLPPPGGGLGLDSDQLDLNVSGLGLVGAYDTRDDLFSPTQGHKVNLSLIDNDDVIGSDFEYTRSELEDCSYFPLGGPFVLGVRADAQHASQDAPFFDLASVQLRGIQAGRYVDNAAVTLESELRWDIAPRWTLVGFGGVGAVADALGEIGSSENHWAGGAGFRYLIAKGYGMRVGCDIARGPEQSIFYVTVGTGWLRD